MTTIITRLYATQADAEAVAAKLAFNKFSAGQYTVVSGANAEEALSAAGVYAAGAKTLAGRLDEGGAVVVVRAPWGRAMQAQAVADAGGPVDAGLRYPDLYQESSASWTWETKDLPELVNYTVASGGLFPPALTRQETPLSSFFGLPLLSEREPRARLSDWTFSGMLGLPTLIQSDSRTELMSENTTPFSTLFGLPTLTRDPDKTFLV